MKTIHQEIIGRNCIRLTELPPRLDSDATDLLNTEFMEILQITHGDIIIDLSSITWIGLGARKMLRSWSVHCKDRGRTIVFFNPSSFIYCVLSLKEFGEYIPFVVFDEGEIEQVIGR